MSSVVKVCGDAAAITSSGEWKECVKHGGDDTVGGDSSFSRFRLLTAFLNFFSLVHSHPCVASEI